LSYLLDTNVLSELVRSRPEPRVVGWFEGAPESTLHVSVLTLGELRSGIEGMKLGGARRERLRLWLEHDLPERFGERVLPVSLRVADRWGRLVADADAPVPAIDSLLAATALVHGLRMVTRNKRDFLFAGLEVISPWES
jgi:predicted nucleic acid-binding protein